MNGKKICLGVLSLLCVVAVSPAWAQLPEKPLGRVSDFAEMLTEDEEAKLDALAERVEATNGAQLAVVTVTSLEGLGVEAYTQRLFKQWGIGHKGKDDGVLLLAVFEGAKARIEVGYGLEGVLNDAKAGRILDTDIMPAFRQGNWAQGIGAGSEQIAVAVTGSPDILNAAVPKPVPKDEALPGWLKIVFPIGLGLFVTVGFLACGAGLRGDIVSVFWGLLFGGIPLLLGHLSAPAMGYSSAILPTWALLMLVLGLLFGKKHLARYGGKWKVNLSIGFGGGGRGSKSSGSGSGSGFGGGASGGGGASR